MALETDRNLRQKRVLVYSALLRRQTQQKRHRQHTRKPGPVQHGMDATPQPLQNNNTLTAIVSEADEMS